MVDIEITEVSDTVCAEVDQALKDHERRNKIAIQQEKKAARWRRQPSAASLDSQESCVVS